jgi:hypothetical protein
MPAARHSQIPTDSLLALRQRLDRLPQKSPERVAQVKAVAELYDVSTDTVYRLLRDFHKPKAAQRADRGRPRVLPKAELERYCELIAALKLRTTNKKGRHLSTRRAIELIEDYGVETPQGLIWASKGLLSRSTVSDYLNRWKLDQPRLTRQPPAVRFQDEFSNACWQFDMSPSDLKQVEAPLWIEPGRGTPTLMLYSVVDDRSGVDYQEYRCVYGEDAESALRFMFNAMAPKPYMPDFSFQGIPEMIYMDCGPVSKSRVFQNVMDALGVICQTHMPAKDGRRVTARSKGKVERPFRTVKEIHETLYHFHRPQNEAITVSRTEVNPIRGWMIGSPTYQQKVFAKCAHGNSSAALPVSQSGARSGVTHGFRWTVPPMRWLQNWPVKPCCCCGGYLTTNSMSNTTASVRGLTPPFPDPFPSTGIGHLRKPRLMKRPTASGNWLINSGCPLRH